jgi:hypothetical protein
MADQLSGMVPEMAMALLPVLRVVAREGLGLRGSLQRLGASVG